MSPWWVLPLLLVVASVFARAQHITFRDITTQAGIHFTHDNGAFGKKWLPEAMGPGCAFIDYDNDGWPDILLINGQDWPGHAKSGATTLKLYHNNHDGTFTDVTRKSGLGLSLFGLGVAVGDYDNDGFDDIFVTAVGQSHLFHNNGNGTFTDVTKSAGLWGPNEFSTSAAWVDYDRDGWQDIFVADGHIEDEIERVQKRVTYAEPPHLFRNLGNGKFDEVTPAMGAGFAARKVARGAAYADINNDGALDVLLMTNGGPAHLYRNEGGTNQSLRVKLVGTKSNRDGIGAVVRVTAGGDKQWLMMRSGSSYLSQSELVLTFGMGSKTKADAVEIEWPSGQRDKLTNIATGQTITIEETKGVIAARPYGKK